MTGYRLSDEADRRLAEIYRYSLVTFGEAQADKYFTSLHEVFETLARNPELGRHFHEYRRHEHQSHVVFYKSEEPGILIVQVLHRSEEAENKFE